MGVAVVGESVLVGSHVGLLDVGSLVGVVVGSYDGMPVVGSRLGAALVGLGLGRAEGTAVGCRVGLVDGEFVKNTVGTGVGDLEGIRVGAGTVWLGVGKRVGLVEGACVG